MEEKQKMTAFTPSVGADERQPSQETCTNSITLLDSECKSEDEMFQLLQKAERFQSPNYIHTKSMDELYETVYNGRPPVIDGLLYQGTYILAGAPKIGKSFLVAELAYHVSTGQPLWGCSVRQGTVLYLALEDDFRRLQERMYRMFGTDCAPNLHFAVSAKLLGNGLEEQLKGFVQEHPDTRLIIIDTLQKIRESGSERYSYASDYEAIGKLKKLADELKLCLLLVHHTRKQQADDRFDMISGTSGLLGAADGAFLFQKEKRTDNTATLDVSGRDQQDQRLYLVRDEVRLVWLLDRRETELYKAPPDPVLEAIAGFITSEQPEWTGTATELVDVLGLDMKPNALAMKLNIRAAQLLSDYNIRYEVSRSHAGRSIKLTFAPP